MLVIRWDSQRVAAPWSRFRGPSTGIASLVRKVVWPPPAGSLVTGRLIPHSGSANRLCFVRDDQCLHLTVCDQKRCGVMTRYCARFSTISNIAMDLCRRLQRNRVALADESIRQIQPHTRIGDLTPHQELTLVLIPSEAPAILMDLGPVCTIRAPTRTTALDSVMVTDRRQLERVPSEPITFYVLDHNFTVYTSGWSAPIAVETPLQIPRMLPAGPTPSLPPSPPMSHAMVFTPVARHIMSSPQSGTLLSNMGLSKSRTFAGVHRLSFEPCSYFSTGAAEPWKHVLHELCPSMSNPRQTTHRFPSLKQLSENPESKESSRLWRHGA
jgi:hypothetical protein